MESGSTHEPGTTYVSPQGGASDANPPALPLPSPHVRSNVGWGRVYQGGVETTRLFFMGARAAWKHIFVKI